jgi:hypothetical protein
MRVRPRCCTLGSMTQTYAVTWRNGDGVLHSGKAELRARALRLDAGGADIEEVRYEDLAGVSIGRTAKERIANRPTLILERHEGSRVRLASISQLGIISELAERLADLHTGHVLARNRIVVVIPLREGVQDQVRAVLDSGPPFDLEESGLRRHEVFLTEREALFVFDGAGEDALRSLLADPGVRAAATVWAEFADGPARIGEEAYAWAKSNAH